MRRKLAWGVLAACSIAAGGCGAGQTAGPAADSVARAADVTARVPGYRIEATMDVSTGTATVHGTMSGTMNTGRRAGVITTHETVAGHSLALTEMLSGTAVYMRAADLPGVTQITGGKPWLKIDLAHAASAMGLSGLQTGSSDPAQFVDYLRAVGARQTRVGSQTVGGVPTTHYRVTIDLDRYARLVPASDRSSARTGVATLESILGSHTLPMDVWIDAHRLVRRMSFTLSECVADHHLRTTMTMNLVDFGPQPIPRTPAASQTYDLTPLLASQMKKVPLGCGTAA